ncbi:MAG: ABC transporter substrate-binding protein [Paracoccaceae bacterium]
MTRIDRRALFASGSAAALLAAVGVSAQAAPVRGGHLRAALSGGDRSESWLDLPGGRFLQAARHAVFETVTEIAPDGTLQPGLATQWSSEDAGRIWHFDIASGVSFHNGTQLSPRDVVTSLQRAGFLAFADGHRVTIELATADEALPFKLARGGIMVFSADQLERGEALTNGTGLYRLGRFDAGRSFLANRVDVHRKDGNAGWFETVEFVAISDPHVRAEAVGEGYVDVADLDDAYDLSGRSDIQLVQDGPQVTGAMRKTVASNTRVGPAPLDDMRFAERWWMAG